MYASPCPGQFGRRYGVAQPWRSTPSRPTGLGPGIRGMHTHTHTAISGEGTQNSRGAWKGGAGQCSRAIVDPLDFNSGAYRRKEKVTVPEISLISNPMGFFRVLLHRLAIPNMSAPWPRDQARFQSAERCTAHACRIFRGKSAIPNLTGAMPWRALTRQQNEAASWPCARKKNGLNTLLLIEIWPRRLVCNQFLEPFEWRFHATQLAPKLALPLQ